jgi:MFS transporter, DHA2 family, multidrug resistance protein
VAVADQLPDALGVPLLEAAREAFTQGLHLAAAVSAAAALAFAILVVVLLHQEHAVTDEQRS